MLKTIKTTKQLRLDEFIKYCKENKIKNEKFYCSTGVKTGLVNGKPVDIYKKIIVDNDGSINIRGYVDNDDLITVEIEEPITEETLFETIVSVIEHDYGFNSISYNTDPKTSIKKFLESYENKEYKVLSIYALIDGKLQLIWERED